MHKLSKTLLIIFIILFTISGIVIAGYYYYKNYTGVPKHINSTFLDAEVISWDQTGGIIKAITKQGNTSHLVDIKVDPATNTASISYRWELNCDRIYYHNLTGTDDSYWNDAFKAGDKVQIYSFDTNLNKVEIENNTQTPNIDFIKNLTVRDCQKQK